MIEALYIHIPFCVSRCAYCDFATSACNDDARMDAYIESLCLQLRRGAKAGLFAGVKTIYIGGGTPTHLGARRLNTLVYTISLSINLENVTEFTIEANPESIDERMVADLFSLGINRFSLGAQSFDDEVLAAYGRAHNAQAISDALEAIHTRTENVSLDLICGGPRQTMESWMQSLKQAIAAGVSHVSVYPLMLEEGTPLAQQVEDGEAEVADEDTQTDMMLLARDVLGEAGFERYEVASYAKRGFESQHNMAYWSGKEYLGLGAGAASMLTTESFKQALAARIFDSYSLDQQVGTNDSGQFVSPRVRVSASSDDVAFADSLGCPAIEVELMDEYAASVEDLMLGMRRSIGVSVDDVTQVDDAQEVFDELITMGLVAVVDGRYIPTERGWLFGNTIYGAIWDLVA